MKNLSMNKIKIVICLFAAAAVGLLLVGFNAYSSKLQYEINMINAQTAEKSYEIANLEVKIESATNVNNLEERALELGLIYPDFDRIITIKSTEGVVHDFASALMQNAKQ